MEDEWEYERHIEEIWWILLRYLNFNGYSRKVKRQWFVISQHNNLCLLFERGSINEENATRYLLVRCYAIEIWVFKWQWTNYWNDQVEDYR